MSSRTCALAGIYGRNVASSGFSGLAALLRQYPETHLHRRFQKTSGLPPTFCDNGECSGVEKRRYFTRAARARQGRNTGTDKLQQFWRYRVRSGAVRCLSQQRALRHRRQFCDCRIAARPSHICITMQPVGKSTFVSFSGLSIKLRVLSKSLLLLETFECIRQFGCPLARCSRVVAFV